MNVPLCSDQKFERLYRAVDRDKNGSLSLEELEHILLPEDAAARQQAVRKRNLCPYLACLHHILYLPIYKCQSIYSMRYETDVRIYSNVYLY